MADYKAIYDSEDDIPDSIDDFKSLFTERDGKFELGGIAGIQTQGNVQRLEKSLKEARADVLKVKSKYEQWKDLDHDEVMAKLDRIPELEAAAEGKLDDSKIDEIVGRRVDGQIRSKLAPLERELKKVSGERDELTESNKALGADAVKRARKDALLPLLVEAKVLPDHYEDVFMYADRHLKQDPESGNFFTADDLRDVSAGYAPKEWLGEMLDKRPGWLPASQGGGARGSGGGGFRGKNPFSKENWSVTDQHRLAREKGMEYADKLAKAAGTEIGSTANAPG